MAVLAPPTRRYEDPVWGDDAQPCMIWYGTVQYSMARQGAVQSIRSRMGMNNRTWLHHNNGMSSVLVEFEHGVTAKPVSKMPSPRSLCGLGVFRLVWLWVFWLRPGGQSVHAGVLSSV